jgi:hypothetical protein
MQKMRLFESREMDAIIGFGATSDITAAPA